MAIKLSRKKLSTVQGQEGIVAAIGLEKTLGQNDDRFVGDPSLRLLLTEEIDKFPFSDALFHISTECSLRCWEDSKAQTAWLESKAPSVKDPAALARFFESHRYSIDATIEKLSKEILKKTCWLLSNYTLDYMLDSAFKKKVMEPMYLAAEIKHEDSCDDTVRGHFRDAIELWGKSNRQVFPGLAHMVNERIKWRVTRGKDSDLSSIFDNLPDFFEKKIEGLVITMTMRPPLSYKMPVTLNKLKDKENRDDN